jgi:hypothetical protein
MKDVELQKGSIAILFLFLAFLVAIAPANAAKTKVWCIDYVNYRNLVPGKTSVCLSTLAIKITDTGGYQLTACAPNWEAVVVNPQAQMYCVLPEKLWRSYGFFGNKDETDIGKITKQSTLLFLCQPAKQMEWSAEILDGFYQVHSAPEKCTGVLIEATNIPCLAVQRKLINAWFGIKDLDAIPLVLGHRRSNGATSSSMHATAISKELRDMALSIPKGYKRVAKLRDLVVFPKADGATD